MPDTYRAAAGF